MTRALVIKTYGDNEIAGAIVSGITTKHKDSESLRRVAMYQHSPEEWAAMVIKAQYDYGQDKPHGRLYEAILGAWALVWLGVVGWFEYFQRWNRS